MSSRRRLRKRKLPAAADDTMSGSSLDIDETAVEIHQPDTIEPSATPTPSSTSELGQIMKNIFKDLQSNRPTGFKGNAVPPFDPEVEGHDIFKWCQTIDDLRDVFHWTAETTVYYAICKLTGLAQTWYRSLPTVKLSWDEWKIKLCEAFPPKMNYSDKLDQMVRRKKLPTETYTKYYYEKLSLLNLCGITGANAVSCIIGGIYDSSVKNSASAGNYSEPAQLLAYLTTIRQEASNAAFGKKKTPWESPSKTRVKSREKMRCFSCGKDGHKARFCRIASDKTCNFCKKKGHVEEVCYLKQNRRVPQAASTL